jgi:hypothetical protein
MQTILSLSMTKLQLFLVVAPIFRNLRLTVILGMGAPTAPPSLIFNLFCLDSYLQLDCLLTVSLSSIFLKHLNELDIPSLIGVLSVHHQIVFGEKLPRTSR